MESATQSPITIIVNSLRGQNIAFATLKDAPLTSIYDTLHERVPKLALPATRDVKHTQGMTARERACARAVVPRMGCGALRDAQCARDQHGLVPSCGEEKQLWRNSTSSRQLNEPLESLFQSGLSLEGIPTSMLTQIQDVPS